MLALAKLKASKNGVNIRFVQAVIRRFDLGETFKFVFLFQANLYPVFTHAKMLRIASHVFDGI